MGSLVKNFDSTKLLGQVYTPPFIVDKILDDVNFNSIHVLGKTILDPACGDGRFLMEIVKRLIKYSPPDDLCTNLTFVYGWDIDPIAIDQCIQNLNLLIQDYEIEVKWNISVKDSLLMLPTHDLFSGEIEKFEYIVGNPPFIRIQHLDEKSRKFIQAHYRLCKKGSTDIYIAFFELAFSILSDSGTCAFITPNTYFYTETAKPLRDLFAKLGCIIQLANYGDIQLFNNATTYSAITIFNKQLNENFVLQEAYSAYDLVSKELPSAILNTKNSWQLSISKQIKNTGIRLGEICKIHVGLTTLCDHAYFFSTTNIDNNLTVAHTRLLGDVILESALLKPLIKASKYKHTSEAINEYALFPYELNGSEHKIMDEDKLERDYPRAYKYLCSIKYLLDKRDNGKPNPVSWYAYGRNQGINLGVKNKIIFSPMNKYPRFVLCESDALFYSGYCILYNGDTNELLEKLNSDSMYDFISISSRDYRGGWKAYNKKIVQEFRLNM